MLKRSHQDIMTLCQDADLSGVLVRRKPAEWEPPADLSAFLDELVRNEKPHATASLLGEKIRSETGIKNAVRLIEETFA